MSTARTVLQWTLALTCVNAMATDRPPDGAKTTPAPQAQSSARADNTHINERDKGGSTLTPQNQTNRAQDREMLASVRRAIVNDKSLSTMAHNVKILSEGGVVTLRGPVKSSDEKAKVESLAQRVKGITSINNQLDVKTTESTR